MNLDKFKQARKAVGLTHEDVADKLGITRQSLYIRIENDTLTIADIRILRRLLKKPTTWFFHNR